MKKFVKSFNEKGYGYVLTVEEENGWYYPTIEFYNGNTCKPSIRGIDMSMLRLFARFNDKVLWFLSESEGFTFDEAMKLFYSWLDGNYKTVEDELKDFYIEMY